MICPRSNTTVWAYGPRVRCPECGAEVPLLSEAVLAEHDRPKEARS